MRGYISLASSRLEAAKARRADRFAFSRQVMDYYKFRRAWRFRDDIFGIPDDRRLFRIWYMIYKRKANYFKMVFDSISNRSVEYLPLEIFHAQGRYRTRPFVKSTRVGVSFGYHVRSPAGRPPTLAVWVDAWVHLSRLFSSGSGEG
jgi:hypothetical protein